MCHPSGMRHAGHRISAGRRWVLVVFVIATSLPQPLRRVGTLAHDAKDAGALDVGEPFFRAAIEMAGDMHAEAHELHSGLGSVLALHGRRAEARGSFLNAAHAYPIAPGPHLNLGKLLLEAGRPRAALRRFERTLALVDDSADDAACEASHYAGLCGVRLAKSHPSHASRLLPTATRRLRSALLESPGDGDPAIEGLLRQVEEMQHAQIA